MRITRDLRNKRFWSGLATHGLAALGVLSATLGLFDLFFPNTLNKVDMPELLFATLIAIIYAIYRSWPYPVEQHYTAPNMSVRLVTGDLFNQDTNLVIGMSDTFDVETPHIIAASSIQGQFLDRVYKHDVRDLNGELKTALANKKTVGTVNKLGNTERYPPGTVATIVHKRTHYFCVAYTKMDENNKASSSIGMLWEALGKLWDEVRIRSNGEPIASPIIGLGQSGMSTILPIQDAIRFLILSFVFASRKERVCEELRIVVRPEDEKRIDMLEIQEFLHSLRK